MSRRFRENPKSEMDSQRDLLDTLMGVNRNMDRAEDEINDYQDDRVCKFYLSGVCSHEMFVNTKMDDGPCELVHSDELKEKFERDNDPYKYDSLIERDFLARINDIDRSIKRARARVEDEKAEESSNPDSNADVLRIQAEVEKTTLEAEAAGEEGNIDAAQELMAKLERLGAEKEAIINRLSEQRRALLVRTGVDVNKKLRVCDVCGSFLSIMDSDKRLADHFMGKQHIGFQVMRDQLEAIKNRREQRRLKADEDRSKGILPSSGGDEGRDRERERDNGRDNSRDRDDRSRGGDRRGDRGRDRDRDRGSDRGDYNRGRDRSRDRGRDGGAGSHYGNGGGDRGSGNRYEWGRGGEREREGARRRGDSRDRDRRRRSRS